MSKLSNLFQSVSVVAVVDGVVVKVTANKAPADFSWNATRETVVKSKELKTSATLDKGTDEERTFRGKDVDGANVEEHLAAARPAKKGKGDRGGIDDAVINDVLNGHNGNGKTAKA